MKIMRIWAATDSICEWKMNHGIASAGSYKNPKLRSFVDAMGLLLQSDPVESRVM